MGTTCRFALCALLGLLACRKEAPPPARAKHPPPVPEAIASSPIAAPPSVQATPVSPSAPAAPLVHVPPRELPGLPVRFDDSGRFMAVLQDEASPPSCLLWDLRELVFVGEVVRERCTTARFEQPGSVALPADLDAPLPENYVRTSPDGKLRAHYSWKESRLSLERPGSAALTVRAGCTKSSCPDVIAVAFSPDGKRLALTRARGSQIFIVDSESGKRVQTLRFDRSELALPRLLSWGQAGIVAYLGQRDDVAEPEVTNPSQEKPSAVDGGASDAEDVPERAVGPGEVAVIPEPADEEDVIPEPRKETPPKPANEEKRATDSARGPGSINGAHLSIWRSPNSRAQRRDFVQEYNSEGLEASLVMDPHGRFLFELLSTPRDGIFLTMFDIAGNRKAPLGWKHPDIDPCTKFERLSAAWLPGTWPVFETLEARPSECKSEVRATRIFTAPKQRGLREVSTKKRPPEGEVRAVKDDGKTLITLRGKEAQKAWLEPTGDVDADKRWQATGRNSLRRLSDQQEIIFEADGCVHTAEWVFDCAPRRFAEQVFLRDADPLKGLVVRGPEVVARYHHPGLLDDFFAGKDVTPRPAGPPSAPASAN